VKEKGNKIIFWNNRDLSHKNATGTITIRKVQREDDIERHTSLHLYLDQNTTN
jgi:hypothetical protein